MPWIGVILSADQAVPERQPPGIPFLAKRLHIARAALRGKAPERLANFRDEVTITRQPRVVQVLGGEGRFLEDVWIDAFEVHPQLEQLARPRPRLDFDDGVGVESG